jgi:hypothetical protein
MARYINISRYDYNKPIEHMKFYFTNINKTNILDNIIKKSNELYKLSYIHYDNTHIDFQIYDYIYLEYIRNRINIEIMLFWTCKDINIDEYILRTRKKNYLFLVKSIEISFLGIQNLIHEFYNIHNIDEINKKIKELKMNDNINKLYLLVFEKISSQPNDDTNYELIKDEKNIILITEIFLHYHTLKHFEKRNIINFLHDDFKKSRYILNNFINWTDNNLTILEKKRLILLTDTCFFLTGIRKFNKIDGLFIDILENSNHETKLQDLIYQITKEPKIMIYINSTKSWMKKKEKYFKQLFVDDYDNTFYFDFCMHYDMYFYYRGIKIITLDTSIYLKIYRNKEKDILDLLCIYRIYSGITDIELFFDINTIKNKNKLKKALMKYIYYDRRKIKIQDLL